MSLRALALSALTTLACASSEAPPPRAEAPPPSEEAPLPRVAPPDPAPPDPATAPPAAPLPDAALPWVWYHTYPEALADAFGQIGTGPVAHDHRVGDRRRYTARRDAEGIELVLERMPEPSAKGEPVLAWRRRVTAPAAHGDPVVQATSGASVHVVVALRTAGGYERHVFTDEGEPVRSSAVLDPAGFGSEPATLQLGDSPAGLVVLVRGRSHAYLDVIDSDTGMPRARARFGPELLHERFPWPPDGPRGRRLGHCWPARDGGCYEARRRREALELRATDPAGAERWRTTLDPRGGAWASMAVVLEHDERVVVVTYQGMASGATVHGVDREHGTLAFTTSPGGIGSIAHSKYANDVGLSLDGEGRVRIHGRESGGDYIGVLDAKAGRLLGHEVWRR